MTQTKIKTNQMLPMVLFSLDGSLILWCSVLIFLYGSANLGIIMRKPMGTLLKWLPETIESLLECGYTNTYMGYEVVFFQTSIIISTSYRLKLFLSFYQKKISSVCCPTFLQIHVFSLVIKILNRFSCIQLDECSSLKLFVKESFLQLYNELL